MVKELPRNIEALQGMAFEEIKKTANNIKRIKVLIDKSIEKNNFKMLEDAKKQADIALEHLEEYTGILNEERNISDGVREKIMQLKKEV